jgi:hypothetical protein
MHDKQQRHKNSKSSELSQCKTCEAVSQCKTCEASHLPTQVPFQLILFIYSFFFPPPKKHDALFMCSPKTQDAPSMARGTPRLWSTFCPPASPTWSPFRPCLGMHVPSVVTGLSCVFEDGWTKRIISRPDWATMSRWVSRIGAPRPPAFGLDRLTKYHSPGTLAKDNPH